MDLLADVSGAHVPRELAVMVVEDFADAQHNMDLDGEIGAAVARGEMEPVIRLWRAAPVAGIGVSRRDVARDSGQKAADHRATQGCAVIVRQTGGTAVPHGPGVFHVSYIFPRVGGSVTTDAYYRLLCAPVLRWLGEHGVVATTGALPGSYCDGNYNVLARGRKLVGTAQAWRGGLAGMSSSQPGYVLAHACVTVDVDLAWAIRHINQFYAEAGEDYRVHPATSVNLRELLPDLFADSEAGDAAAIAMADFRRSVTRLLLDAGVRINPASAR